MPRGGAPCSVGDPFHCFGNGNCTRAQCECTEGWTGSQCTTLDLAPAPRDGAIRRAGWSTWGGSPIRGADGRIHLFASQMANKCSLGTWQNNSLVIHAVSVSDTITGPYSVVEDELVLPPFHHNPSVQRAPDGTYLIYCIGAKAGSCQGGPFSNCTGATIKHCGQPPDDPLAAEATETGHARERVGSASGGLDGVVHLAHSKSLSGPWELTTVLTGRPGRWDAQSTNPAPHVLANGTALLVYRGVNGLGTDRIGAARAARGWSDKYERVADLPLFGRCGNWTSCRSSSTAPAETGCVPVHNWTAELGRSMPEWDYVCDECVGWAEDPFLYSTSRGYHMLTHNLHGAGGRAAYALFNSLPLFVQWGKTSTLCAWPPLCRDMHRR